MGKYALEKIALSFFVLAVLLPQGIGLRFEIAGATPQLDLPRIFMIAVVCLSVFQLIKKNDFSFFNQPVVYLLVGFSLWLFNCSYLSVSSDVSFAFSVRLVILTTVFSLALGFLISYASMEDISRFMLVILLGLIAMSVGEFLFQDYLVPMWMRTAFYEIPGYELYTSQRLTRDGLLLSQGGFLWNHPLAGMLCVFSGIAFRVAEQTKKIGTMILFLLFLAVAATGVRAAMLALVAAFFLWAIVSPSGFSFLVKGLIAGVFTWFAMNGGISFGGAGQVIGTGYTQDLMTSAINVSPKQLVFDWERCAIALSNFTFSMLSVENAHFLLSETGTMGIRLAGLISNFLLWDDWWLSGFGPGAFFSPDKVHSNAFQFDDPGLIFVILFDSGVIGATLFMSVLIMAIYKGFKTKRPENIAMSVGLVSWFVFALSSWAIWPLLPAMVMVVVQCSGCFSRNENNVLPVDNATDENLNMTLVYAK